MANSIARIEDAAGKVSKAASRLAEHDDERRLALGAVFVAALFSWLSLAWGEPLLLLTVAAVGFVFWKVLQWMRIRSDRAEQVADEPVEIEHSRLQSAVRIARSAYSEPSSQEHLPTSDQFPSFGPLPTLSSVREQEAPAETADEPEGERYEVRDAASSGAPLLVVERFDEAADFALDFLASHEERTLEIVHVHGGERGTVSRYAKAPEGEADSGGSLIDLYGFPGGWRAAPPSGARRD